MKQLSGKDLCTNESNSQEEVPSPSTASPLQRIMALAEQENVATQDKESEEFKRLYNEEENADAGPEVSISNKSLDAVSMHNEVRMVLKGMLGNKGGKMVRRASTSHLPMTRSAITHNLDGTIHSPHACVKLEKKEKVGRIHKTRRGSIGTPPVPPDALGTPKECDKLDSLPKATEEYGPPQRRKSRRPSTGTGALLRADASLHLSKHSPNGSPRRRTTSRRTSTGGSPLNTTTSVEDLSLKEPQDLTLMSGKAENESTPPRRRITRRASTGGAPLEAASVHNSDAPPKENQKIHKVKSKQLGAVSTHNSDASLRKGEKSSEEKPSQKRRSRRASIGTLPNTNSTGKPTMPSSDNTSEETKISRKRASRRASMGASMEVRSAHFSLKLPESSNKPEGIKPNMASSSTHKTAKLKKAPKEKGVRKACAGGELSGTSHKSSARRKRRTSISGAIDTSTLVIDDVRPRISSKVRIRRATVTAKDDEMR